MRDFGGTPERADPARESASGTGRESSGTPKGPAPGTAEGPAIRVALPTHLRVLADVGREVEVWLATPSEATQRHLLDEVERLHPRLRGTIRDHDTGARRAYMRYFAGRDDLSHDDPDALLPAAVRSGEEPFRVVGAIAGG